MARRSRRELSLPWEHRGNALSRLLSGPRWKVGLVLFGVFGLGASLWSSADHRGRVDQTRISISILQDAIQHFRADIGRCPHSITELVHPPRSGARYLRRAPKDGWGHDLHMECPGHFDPDGAEVLSAGPSGSLNVDDNIQ